MTDNTQPEAMGLADWLEAVGGGPSAKRCAALLREQHTRIAELESELEAVGAGGVQALSAGPMVTSEQRRLIGVIAEKIEDGTLFQSGIYPKKDLARFVRNMLDTTPTAPAASPTPPAEQQVIIDFAQVGTAGPFHVVNGRVKLPDATMQDLARMLRPTYEAEQAAPKVDGFYEAVNDMDGLYQAAPKAAPGDVLDESLRERDDAEDFIDALLDEVLGHERPEWSSSYGRADALNDVQERMTALHKPAVDKAWGRFQSAMAAPQQEAREAAPGESLDECFPGESRVAVPQGLISAACFAIRNKRDGGKVLEQLRRYSVGDLSQPLAPRQEAQEPIGHLRMGPKEEFVATKRAEELDIDVWHPVFTAQPAPQQEAQEPVAWLSPWRADRVTTDYDAYGERGIPLYTAPQPAPAPLSEMSYEKRKAIQEGGQIGASDAWFKARHEMLDTVDRRNVFRAGFDRGWNAAIAAQGGKDAE